MNAIDTKSMELLSEKTFKKDWMKQEDWSRDDHKIVEVTLVSNADATTFGNGMEVSFHVFDVNDYHQTELFVRIELINNLHILLCSVNCQM